MSEAESTTDETVEERPEYTAAFVRASTQTLQKLVRETALTKGGGPVHDTLYFNISDGQMQSLASTHGKSVVSFTTWNEEKLKEVDVTEQTVNNTDEDENPSLEAVVDTQEFLNYLEIASNGGIVELNFIKEPAERLAQALEIDSKLTARVPLPGSQAVLEEVPLGLPSRINDEEVMVNGDGNQLPTNISSSTQELQKVVDAVDLHEDAEEDFYPIVVDDGEFVLNVGDTKSQQIFGALSSGVEGPDLDNEYHVGFEEAVKSLSGNMEVYSAPGGGPFYVLQDGSGETLRHSLGSLN